MRVFLALVSCAAWLAVIDAASARPIATTTTATSAKNPATVWNAQAKVGDGTYKKIVFLGEKPDALLPPCRCVAGTWKRARRGETATHFIGTLDAPSFNHKRAGSAKKRLSIKVRKTRELMGMHRDYRPTLHGILRGSGQLVLREVTGGQWEVVGYAPEPVGTCSRATRAGTPIRSARPVPRLPAPSSTRRPMRSRSPSSSTITVRA